MGVPWDRMHIQLEAEVSVCLGLNFATAESYVQPQWVTVGINQAVLREPGSVLGCAVSMGFALDCPLSVLLLAGSVVTLYLTRAKVSRKHPSSCTVLKLHCQAWEGRNCFPFAKSGCTSNCLVISGT